MALMAGLALSFDAAAAQRTLTTKNGPIQLDGTPSQVVTLGENALDAVVALGLKPAGALASRGGTDIPGYIKDKTGALPIVGTVREPNLEAILALQPDLILATSELSKEMYEKLSLIAPTVVPGGNSFQPWEDLLRLYGQAVDRPAEAEKRIAEIDARIAALRARLPAGATTSVVRWMPQGAMMMSSHLFVGQLLEKLGLRSNALADSLTERPHSDILSLENIAKIDADWLFLATLNPDGSKALDDARQQPAFTRLKAVQDKHAVSVDGQVWSSSSGYLAAQRILDDVEKALAK